MDEPSEDERKQKTEDDELANSETTQLQEVSSEFAAEKELLEKRHKEEIEQLKETFSKERHKVLETQHRGQSIDQSESSSMLYNHASHSSVAHTTHSRGNGHIIHDTEQVLNAEGVYQNGTLHGDTQQHAVHRNKFGSSHSQNSGKYSGKVASSVVGQSSYDLLRYPGFPNHQTDHREAAFIQQYDPPLSINSQAREKIFSEEQGQELHFGMSSGGISHQHNGFYFQNVNSTSSDHNTGSQKSVYGGNTASSYQHLNTSLQQRNVMNVTLDDASRQNSRASGTQGFSHNDVATTVGHRGYAQHRQLHSERQNGPSSSWHSGFYASNLHSDNLAANGNDRKDVYGASFGVVNGPAVSLNSGGLASQIRPDLDLEDQLEQQREILQDRFLVEKRQLEKTLLEEYTRKHNFEKRKYEESLQAIKQTKVELEYQRKEIDVKIRHERERLEMKFESERSEYERKLRKSSEDHRSKSILKYETEMQQQREKYEEVIKKQKMDIESLTTQISELNETLKQEKDLIVAKFESEVKDIEQRLRAQKEKCESELVVKLKSEISLLTSVNASLREEVDMKEKEKQELEIITREERKRSEVSYECHISELEAHFEAEKQVIIVQHEEKLASLLAAEKSSLDEVMEQKNEEIISIKKENETLRKIVEENYEVEQRGYDEREEMFQALMEEKELLRTQLEEAFSKNSNNRNNNEKEAQLLMLDTQKELHEAQDISAKLQNDLKNVEKERNYLAAKVEQLLQETDTFRQKQEVAGSVIKENERLLREVAKLNEEMDKMFEDMDVKGRREVALKEKLFQLEELVGQKESENTAMKMEKMENQSKLNILERQNDDLKDDLSSLRRRKMEVDKENSALMRGKSSSEGKLSVLQTTNEGLVQELHKTKQKISEGEEAITVLKLEKLELQKQVRMLKTHQSSYQDTSAVSLNGVKSDSEGSESVLTSADENGERTEKDFTRRAKRKSSLERQVNQLKRVKAELENNIDRLRQDIDVLEREAMKQIEHNKSLSAQFIATKKDSEKQIEELKRSRNALEESVSEKRQEEKNIEGKICLLGKQKKELECGIEYLYEEEKRIKEANVKEMDGVSQMLNMRTEEGHKQISLLERNKKELQTQIEKMECDEATLRCSIEELQKESEILTQRISQMNEGVKNVGRKGVSWIEDKDMGAQTFFGVSDVQQEITTLRRERDSLIRNVNELERKQTNLDISVGAAEENRLVCEKDLTVLKQKKKDLESAMFLLRTEKFELETKVNELSVNSVEHSTSAQQKEIELLRSELEVTRESCQNIRSMYYSVEDEGHSKMEVVEMELRMAEDSLARLKRERLELEKTISTLLRQKTELETEVAMVVDAKYREDRDTVTLRQERLDLDAEVLRLKSQVSGLRTLLSTLEDTKVSAERELENLKTRRESVDRCVSGMETRLLIGQTSPNSCNLNQNKEYVLTPRDDLEKQVLELREQNLSLEADLFKLRRKSGDGIDARSRAYGVEKTTGVSFRYLGTAEDYGAQYSRNENKSLQKEIEGLAHEKSKLSSELTEMKVRRNDLDAQITNLEYRKLGLEQSGRLVSRREGEVQNEGGKEIKATSVEDLSSPKMDFVDYSVEQMQELRQKNSCLEQKLRRLERQLHELKYEMEMQTLDYQKELRLVQDTLKYQQNDPQQQIKLNLIVGRLKTFLENCESSNTEKLYEEIKNEIGELSERVDANSHEMRNIQKHSFVQQEQALSAGSVLMKSTVVDEIFDHIRDAEEGVEKYNNVASQLQRENIELTEIVSKLQERLDNAGKSYEKLQRKKAILQQLLEKVGQNTGEDLIEQSNLIFELDKDVAV